jgi:hypothetical protein
VLGLVCVFFTCHVMRLIESFQLRLTFVECPVLWFTISSIVPVCHRLMSFSIWRPILSDVVLLLLATSFAPSAFPTYSFSHLEATGGGPPSPRLAMAFFAEHHNTWATLHNNMSVFDLPRRSKADLHTDDAPTGNGGTTDTGDTTNPSASDAPLPSSAQSLSTVPNIRLVARVLQQAFLAPRWTSEALRSGYVTRPHSSRRHPPGQNAKPMGSATVEGEDEGEGAAEDDESAMWWLEEGRAEEATLYDEWGQWWSDMVNAALAVPPDADSNSSSAYVFFSPFFLSQRHTPKVPCRAGFVFC